MKPMTEPIEQINSNVFRAHRTDLRQNPEEVFNDIYLQTGGHFSCLVVSSRKKAYVNGSGSLIEDVDNDYRSHYLIIVHKNTTYPVMFGDHEYEVITDHYGNILGVNEPEYQIELLTCGNAWKWVVDAFSKQYDMVVDFETGKIKDHAS